MTNQQNQGGAIRYSYAEYEAGVKKSFWSGFIKGMSISVVLCALVFGYFYVQQEINDIPPWAKCPRGEIC